MEPQRPWGAGEVGKVSKTTRGPNIWCFLHMQASISHPHSESSARTRSHRHLLKKCKIYQSRNARVHHVLSLWTLILALRVAHNCSLLVHTPFYITRWDILRPVQPQKVTRAACSGHTYLMSCITFSALAEEGQMGFTIWSTGVLPTLDLSTHPVPPCLFPSLWTRSYQLQILAQQRTLKFYMKILF